ncbi:endocuticle structural protein SgAbd-6-like [Phymastichus coffea]|uniref:endocuticle structural protein SgAbd-6-like n=1 Tax=Phymastichus coffea TaxID=108790 RepID=UPI00273CACC0|nr:endocuticle structural protein SgAbd-6-like [Phymastichus coffea]
MWDVLWHHLYQAHLRFIVFSAFLAIAMADHLSSHYDPEVHKPEVVVVKETPSDNIGLGNYQFAYELSDGQKRDEQAQFEARANSEESVLRIHGSFSWVNPTDGQTYTVSYVADENGFQPQGAHLPVAPIA